MDMKTENKLKKTLKGEVGTADWKALNAHFKRDALIAVSSDLDIVEVGLMIAMDNTEQIRLWLNRGKIGKPTIEEADEWKERATEFTSLILSPFVLIQPLPRH